MRREGLHDLEWILGHDWPTDKKGAYAILSERAKQVDCTANISEPTSIVAVEAAYGHGGASVYAAAIALTFPDLQEVERSYFHLPTEFPYIPGLFYFREGPALVNALLAMKTDPDLIMVSGHGIAHPKQCGIASHIGMSFDKPTIGVARRLLTGTHRPVKETKGSSQPIRQGQTELGVAYRSKDNVKPIFISPGHQCDLAFARNIVVRCLRGYRLPEPLRFAHLLANKHKRYVERDNRNKQPDPAP